MSKQNKDRVASQGLDFILSLLEDEIDASMKEKKKVSKIVIDQEVKVTDTLSITKQIVQGPVVICFWSDGTKTKAKSMIPENFDYEVGLTVCICKKLLGEDLYFKILNQNCKIFDERGTVINEKNSASKKDTVESKNKPSCKKCSCCKNDIEDEYPDKEEDIDDLISLFNFLSFLATADED